MADGDPLTPGEREEYEEDLISFCDRELDRLGDVRGLDVLYAGGVSLLWLEGLSQRIGEAGTLTALETDEERVEAARLALPEAELRAPVRVVAGDVFHPPFEPRSFDLVYSAGLFHELDVRKAPASSALKALGRRVRPDGRVVTGDFVDTMPAAQVEEEALQAELYREVSGGRLYGIGSPERLVALHEELLSGVRWSIAAPHHVRHLEKLALAGEEPPALRSLASDVARRFRERYEALRGRIRREGYTRPATIYVEGRVPGGDPG